MKKILLILIILLMPTVYLSCAEKEHKDWNTYKDKRFNFSIQYPKNWEIEFWKDKIEPDPYFGRLADYSKGLIIEFAFYELEQSESLNDFVRHTVDKHDQFYFKETKKLDVFPVIRYGAHLYLEDGESYVLRQFVKINKESIIDLMADLPKDSIEKKDDKYQLLIEIMDTFKGL